MADTLTIKVDGLKALAETLQRMPAELSADLLDGAVTAGARVVLEAARSRVRRRRGKLARTMRLQTIEKDAAHAVVHVQARERYAHLVEFGHQLVKGGRLGKGGRVVGHVPAYPFLRPAFDETQEQALARIAEVLFRTIDESQALRRLGARHRPR